MIDPGALAYGALVVLLSNAGANGSRSRPFAKTALVVLLLGLGACSKDVTSGQKAGQHAAAEPVAVQSAPVQSAAAGPQARSDRPEPARDPAFSGPTWASCYAGFHPQGGPVRDLTRLTLLCGPYHGLNALGAAHSGTLGPGARSSLTFSAERSQCFRLFAVGDASLSALSLQVRDSAGRLMAQSPRAKNWLVVPTDGVFCAPDRGSFSVELQAQQGQGSYALQVWVLP